MKAPLRTHLQPLRGLLMAFIGFLMIQTQAVKAAPLSYQCQILQELHLHKDGSLRQYPNPRLIGKRFAIDRRNGNLVAPEGSLWNFLDSQTSLIANGNTSNAFIATYSTPSRGGGVHLTMIRISEFEEGPAKPFLVTSGGEVHSGICE